MDWSNYDNELFKKFSDNLFDDYIDNKIQCGNLIDDNNCLKDYEIKPDEFILDLNTNRNNCPQKVDLNLENFYGNNFNVLVPFLTLLHSTHAANADRSRNFF